MTSPRVGATLLGPLENPVVIRLLPLIAMLVVLIGFLAGVVDAIENEARSRRKPAEQRQDARQSAGAKEVVAITIDVSQPKATAGAGLGVIGELKNVSETAVYLCEKTTVLLLPPELRDTKLAPGFLYAKYAYFPTELPFWRDEDACPKWRNPRTGEEEWNSRIKLSPGDAYKMFWTTEETVDQSIERGGLLGRIDSWIFGIPQTARQSGTTGSDPQTAPKERKSFMDYLQSELSFIVFTPGTYTIFVEAKYWTDPKIPGDGYRTTNSTFKIDMAAPQTVILLGAAIGGLLAYFIKLQWVDSPAATAQAAPRGERVVAWLRRRSRDVARSMARSLELSC